MKKAIFATLSILAVIIPATSVSAERIDDPVGVFSDGSNSGYAEANTDGSVRACNENPDQPAGDQLTGYIWVNPNGEGTTPSYGNANVGAGDADGEGAAGNDCP